ncbi:glycoside hydrolase family 3 C-terminal domain-containing protein [Alteromonas sp. M12]|uniref:beta-glucosidase n=1 Tax=Alteromonas sp. M12 TaxID=3135644 RepID=UPI00319E7B53
MSTVTVPSLISAYSAETKKLLSQLTLEEKAKLSSGKDFWRLQGIERFNLPSIMVTDGPHGLRKQPDDSDHIGLNDSVPATCFPTASGLAASWNRELLAEVGNALADECLAEKVSVLLGPGVNIKRNPLGGRNFEYFSEDPYLSGEMSIAWIDGLQSKGIGCSLKHYAVNNHESSRMITDVIIDERTLREIYLPAFEFSVKKTQPWTVMSAYNKVDGTYLAENRKFLTDILQQEWGYQGLVVTDWGGNHNRVLGIKNGQGLEMPSSGDINTNRIIRAVKCGDLSMEELDKSVGRVLDLIIRSRDAFQPTHTFSVDSHHALARKAAEEASVLLKNDGGLLPLSTTDNIAVIGEFAKNTRYQGSGSSQIIPTKLEQPYDAIAKLIDSDGLSNICYCKGYHLDETEDQQLISEALKIAQNSDKVIVILGLPTSYESEGFDRKHMHLPKVQLDLIAALAPVYEKLVIVLQNGSPVELPFANQVPAILEAYLGGQAGASALANIIFGQVNPSGKLAETFPVSIDDVPSQPWFPGESRQVQYRESIWVGYRYFDTAEVPVLFPFGHGLSYTTFEYSDLTIQDNHKSNDENTFDLTSVDDIVVSFNLKNTGNMTGAEVAQLYIGQQNSSVHRPKKELKNFAKVSLAPGESQRITMQLCKRDFAFWCSKNHKWRVETDQFNLFIGASISDIRLCDVISIQGDNPKGAQDVSLSAYFSPKAQNYTEQDFQNLLGKDIPPALPSKPFQLNSTMREVKDTWIGGKLFQIGFNKMTEKLGEMTEQDKLVINAIFDEMTLRQLVAMSDGKFKPKVMDSLIHIMNKDWIKLLCGAGVRSE